MGYPDDFRPPITRPWAWLVMAAALAVAFAMWRVAVPTGIGKMADYSWKVVDLEGREADLGDFRGKALFLNVWATWCGPCVEEMPSISRLANDPRLTDVVFVCVSVDEDLAPVRKFVAENDVKATVLHATEEPPEVFQSAGIPSTYLIAPDGRIESIEIGSREWHTRDVVETLQNLAARGQ